MRKIIKSGQRFSRRVVDSVDAARAELAAEPFKLELVDLKSDGSTTAERRRRRERRGRRRRADHLRQPARAHRGAGLGRPLPRSARADHPVHPGVPADPDRRRVLARQREEPAAATDLRHRVGVAGGAGATPRAARRGRAPRPPPARRRARPVLVPRRDRLRPGGFPPARRHHPQGAGGLLPAAAHRGGLLASSTPRTSPRRSCSRSPGTSTGMRTACSRRCISIRSSNDDGTVRKPGQDYYLKPMNCPMHTLIYRSPRSVVPRAAAADVRVRLASTGTRSPAWCTVSPGSAG